MSLNSIISISGSLIVLIITILATKYKTKKEGEYKNDERWLAIKDEASKKLSNYHVFLLASTGVAMVVGTILGGDEILYVNFEIMIMVIFVMLASRDLAELFLLRKYDKTM